MCYNNRYDGKHDDQHPGEYEPINVQHQHTDEFVDFKLYNIYGKPDNEQQHKFKLPNGAAVRIAEHDAVARHYVAGHNHNYATEYSAAEYYNATNDEHYAASAALRIGAQVS